MRGYFLYCTGRPSAPAYVLDSAGGRQAWRYMQPKMPANGDPLVGYGDGCYADMSEPPKAVVAIVGTAHVGGIVREWGLRGQ